MFSAQSKKNLEFLSIQNLTLKQMGIDINSFKGTKLIMNYWKFLFLISCVIYLQFGLLNFVAHSGISNIDMASRSLSMFNQGCLILTKITIFLVKGEKFKNLIRDIKLLAMKANPSEYKKWLSQNLRSQLEGKVYFYACWIAVGSSGIFPLILMAFDYKQNKTFDHKLPFGGKFPWDKGGLLAFSINYVLSLMYIYGLLNMTVGIDTLYGWYVHSVSGHFRILRCKVESVALKLENNDYSNFTYDIGLIGHYHNQVLKFVQDLNDIFGEILWAEVVLSSLQICFAVYAVYNDDNIFNMPFNLLALLAMAIQLVIYCFGGEKIKNESLMLSVDFYLKFPWHSMTPKEKKLMLLPLMRSQRLSVLRAPFFEVDRNLLVYILRTAFSYNALLSAMKE